MGHCVPHLFGQLTQQGRVLAEIINRVGKRSGNGLTPAYDEKGKAGFQLCHRLVSLTLTRRTMRNKSP